MRVFGDKVLAALQRRPLIEELLVGADPTPMLIQLDALFACGMAELEATAPQTKTGKKAPEANGEKTDPIALSRLPVASVVLSRRRPRRASTTSSSATTPARCPSRTTSTPCTRRSTTRTTPRA